MSTSPIGKPISRIDGPLKVSGRSPYAIQYRIPNLAFAVAVTSTIGSGRITGIDMSQAEKMLGVLTILHHGKSGQLYRPAGSLESVADARPIQQRQRGECPAA